MSRKSPHKLGKGQDESLQIFPNKKLDSPNNLPWLVILGLNFEIDVSYIVSAPQQDLPSSFFKITFTIWNYIHIHKSGQIIIFQQPRFAWNKGSHFPYQNTIDRVMSPCQFSRPPPSVGESWVDAFASVEPHEWSSRDWKSESGKPTNPPKKKRVRKISPQGLETYLL